MIRILVTPMAAVLALVTFLALAPVSSAEQEQYAIRDGDTLSELAERYGTTVEAIAKANGIVEPDLIISGQVLLISRNEAPSPAGKPSEVSGGAAYVVELGDTLSEIAERFGVPAEVLAEVNGLNEVGLIIEGQVLNLPAIESPLVPPVNPEIEALLEEFAAEEGLDAGLVKAVAYVESGWNQGAVSHTGAIGVMQIQPSTGYWLEQDIFGFDLNLEKSAQDNIRAGVRYLALLSEITEDMDQALAAYYQGYGVTSLGILYEDTVGYVAAVRAVREMFWPGG